MQINLSVDTAGLSRRLGVASKQIQFGSVLAATKLAQLVQQAETDALPGVLDRPTPFTMKAFGVTAARKSNPQAEVFAKQAQAKYLMPSEVGGEQVLGAGRKIRTPVDLKTNAYGNLPKGAIARKLNGGQSSPGKRGFFLGVVKGINGLWQRVPGNRRKGSPPGLKLLIAFTRPVDVKAHLGFQARARKVVGDNAGKVLADMIAKALGSAK